jgi:hypothetical protein
MNKKKSYKKYPEINEAQSNKNYSYQNITTVFFSKSHTIFKYTNPRKYIINMAKPLMRENENIIKKNIGIKYKSTYKKLYISK